MIEPQFPDGEPPAPRHGRSPRALWIGIAAAVAVIGIVVGIVVAATSSGGTAAKTPTPAAARTFTVSGFFTLADSIGVLNLDDVNCQGMDGYDDLKAGASVAVTDASGTTIALGSLPAGTLIGSGITRTCQFEFTVPNVPAGKGFYGIEISHRGAVKMTEAQIRQNVELSVGG